MRPIPISGHDVETPVSIGIDEGNAAPVLGGVFQFELGRALGEAPVPVIAKEARPALVVHVHVHPRRRRVILTREERATGDASAASNAHKIGQLGNVTDGARRGVSHLVEEQRVPAGGPPTPRPPGPRASAVGAAALSRISSPHELHHGGATRSNRRGRRLADP